VSSAETDEDAPYAAALSALPGMGPATLTSILRQRRPREAWESIVAGTLVRPERSRPTGAASPELPLATRSKHEAEPRAAASWQEASHCLEPRDWWQRAAGRGVRVTWQGHPAYPAALACDPSPPGVLFWRGSIDVLDRPCVAIVGTRNATPDGRSVAYELGRDLAAVGVCVISGLALGIDGAAHFGALSSSGTEGFCGPVGVAASGVDVPYPRRHGRLWESVAAEGAIVSETLPGRHAEAWRFPVRNRIIAGLSRMVVVVESHAAGGSLITAEAAIERGVDVRVVPGPVHSPACAGSNQLLYDGPGPVRDAQDVLDALGLLLPSEKAGGGGATRSGGPEASSSERSVLDALGWRPAGLNQIVARTGLPVSTVSCALDALEAAGKVSSEGGWWSRCGHS
jgi:DNA processing protein